MTTEIKRKQIFNKNELVLIELKRIHVERAASAANATAAKAVEAIQLTVSS